MTTIQYKLLWLCDQVPTALGATLEEDGVAFTTTDNSRTAIQEALHKGTDCVVLDRNCVFSVAELKTSYPDLYTIYLHTEDDLGSTDTDSAFFDVPTPNQLRIALKQARLKQQSSAQPNKDIAKLLAVCQSTKTPLSEKLQVCLTYGIETLGLDMGIVSHIEDGTYTVVEACVAAGDPPPPGTTFETGSTYCDITTSALGIVAIEHMRDSEYHNHPCYDAFKLEAYIGAPLWRQNKVVGTVNFSAAEARKAFSQEEVTRVLFLAKMITQLQVEEESHSYTAKDHLTGLFTRKHGEEVLDALTKTPSLERQFGITFIDLDDFKEVNDTHGHSAGDVVLRTCAERLLHATRPDDTVCRWGGDEFLIISPRCEHANAQAILGRISRQLKQPINFDGLSCSIGVSGGFAHGGECQDWNHLIELADSRMYRAKRSQKTWEKPRLVKTN